jgi:outer membrane protein assembly factor BamB
MRRTTVWSFGSFAAVLTAAGAAHAVTVSGTVFADEDGDGQLGPGDTPLAGVTVFYGTTVTAKTDAAGHYSLSVPSDGLVWSRSPDNFVPTPTWRALAVAGGDQTVDLPLTRRPVNGPLRFIQASDSHVASDVVTGDALIAAMDMLATASPAPHFVMICGDMTQATLPDQMTAVKTGAQHLGTIPFVAVAGNHDWGDGGTAFHQTFGPSMYSFDAGGVHFIILDQQVPVPESLAFITADMASVPQGMLTAAAFHFPPAFPSDDPFIDGMKAAGVNMIFTGHWHQDRVLHWDGLINYDMSPFVMAGMDGTPGSYRVVTIDHGQVSFEPHTTVEHPVLEVVNPLPGTCVPPGNINLIAAIEQGAVPVAARASVDGAAPVALTFAGGWGYVATAAVAGEGDHNVAVTITTPAGDQTVTSKFCTRNTTITPPTFADWPQFQGGPTHTGNAAATVTPPLRTLWATNVGGYIRGGSPVLAGNRLFVSVVDLGDGSSGGLIALDATTGATLWRHVAGVSVNNSAAVDGDTVVIGLGDGRVQALDAATGAQLWEVNIADGLAEGSSNLYAAPVIADGVAYVGVVQNLAAIEVATGKVLWQVDPSSSQYVLDTTYSTLAVKDGVIVGLFGRGYEGMQAFDAGTGAKIWTAPAALSTATQAAPVIVGDNIYTGSSATDVYQLDLMTGDVAWQTKLISKGFVWGYWITGTPAWADGKLFVPTQVNEFAALDDTSGTALWTLTAEPSVVHPVHYQAQAQAFTASPVVTGGLAWIPGADGILRAVDPDSGIEVWALDLGAPILSGVVPAHPLLFVGTWDGTVRALVEVAPGEPTPELPLPQPGMPSSGGCEIQVSGDEGILTLVPFAAFFAIAIRRRKPR